MNTRTFERQFIEDVYTGKIDGFIGITNVNYHDKYSVWFFDFIFENIVYEARFEEYHPDYYEGYYGKDKPSRQYFTQCYFNLNNNTLSL